MDRGSSITGWPVAKVSARGASVSGISGISGMGLSSFVAYLGCRMALGVAGRP